MEVHLNKEQDLPTEADLHRFVLMVGHSFTDRLKFWSEIEVEHAFVEGAEESGEVAIEQAYIDLMLHRRFNLRAGMVLVPVGIVNERHEPPTFHGVERTFVDTVIVPTTWRDTGVGAFGDLGRGFSYRAFVVPGLDATGFTAEEGIEDGRQQGGHADASDPAVTGRLEYRHAGLTAGGSFWAGGSGFGLIRLDIETPTVSGGVRSTRAIGAAVTSCAASGRWSTLAAPAISTARCSCSRATVRTLRAACSAPTAKRPRACRPTRWAHEVVAFGRYEMFDTQNKMPDGLPAARGTAALGGGRRARRIFPIPTSRSSSTSVNERNKSEGVRGPWRVNFGVGWWF